MSNRAFRHAAIGAAGLIVILLLAAFFLESPSERFPVVVVGTFCLTLAGLGCLIGLRHARNPIGWLMLGSAFFITLVLFSVAYGRYAVAHLGVLARPDLVASIALWAGIRRLRGLERQQMKWFVFSVAMFPVFFGLSAAVFIDRRFYRQKYDAAKTLTAFSVRLRDQVDLGSLKNELVGVIGATMQPAHASVWLRGEVPS